MKTGKEVKIEPNKNYNVVLGTVNNKDPKALYINISAWAEPINDDELNYSRIIRDLDKQVRQNLFNNINKDILTPFIKEHTIVDFEIKKSGIRFGKRSFLNCEITLFLKQENQINPTFFKTHIETLIASIINQTFENDNYFKFYKKKR